MNKLEKIKGVIATADVRDPHSALRAIETIIAEPEPKKVKPALKLIINDTGLSGPTCAVEVSKKIKPNHVHFAINCLRDLARKKANEVAEEIAKKMDNAVPECLAEMLKRFEAESRKPQEGKL